MDHAARLFPSVLSEILAYTDLVDDKGDPDGAERDAMAARIEALTGKDTEKFDLVEWWEGEGAEVIAFRLALPDPPTLPLTKADLEEVVGWIHAPGDSAETLAELSDRLQPDPPWEDQSFARTFTPYLDDYFHELLRRNCKWYDFHKLFGSHQHPDGTRTELSTTQVVDALLAAQR
ncbi:MAG: hypothetical protein FWF02_08140 [Micrococcales bacterium]|nr:hypothetical protein [Micrococcales bacterium]